MSIIEKASSWLLVLFAVDRALKTLAVWKFFRRPPPSAPRHWPTLSLLQPLTRGVRDLEGTLLARLRLHYPHPVQHLWIVDQADLSAQAVCGRLRDENPSQTIQILVVAPDLGSVASKARKLREALAHASGEVLWFLDDDVTLSQDALVRSVPYLLEPNVGSIFGLARYSNWRNLPSSAMSAFVNANALLSYIPLTYLTEPYTITGHSYGLRRDIFERIGGMDAVAGRRADDDHELARLVQRNGLRNVQTPLIYGVDNDLSSLSAYLLQMQRWFVLPRRLMLPHLTRRDQAVTWIGSAANIVPSLLFVATLVHRSTRMVRLLTSTFVLTLGPYFWLEHRYSTERTSLVRLPLVLVGSVLDPLLIILNLLRGDTISWRGQRLRVHEDGTLELVEE